MSFQDAVNERLAAVAADEQERLASLWKVFGLETEAGKKLFLMYNAKNKMRPQISYPKVVPRPKKPAQENEDPNRINPTVAPLNPAKLNSVNNPNFARNPKIMSVPKRKNEVQIQKDNAEYFKDIDYKLRPGVDRAQLIESLQKKFKFANLKLEGLVAQKAQGSGVSGKAALLEKKFVLGVPKPKTDEKKLGEREELNQMFDEIVAEVEEKQREIARIENTGRTEEVQKLKWEIVERVSDLEKITKLMRKAN